MLDVSLVNERRENIKCVCRKQQTTVTRGTWLVPGMVLVLEIGTLEERPRLMNGTRGVMVITIWVHCCTGVRNAITNHWAQGPKRVVWCLVATVPGT